MRITNNLLIHNMLWNMNNNLVSMNEKQTQLATGKRIHRPSDDPVGTTRIIKVKSDIAENAQYKENVRDAQSWLDVSENSLMDTKDILQRIRELAVQGANDTYTEEETDKIAKEIDQLLEEIIVNANSTIAGRYLFSGFNTDQKLLNEDGTYNLDITSEKLSDFKAIAYEVAVGEQLEVGTNYLDVYGAILNDNVMTNTFKFKTATDSNVGEEEAYAMMHSKIQGPVDYTQDLTAETMTISLQNPPGSGTTYTYTVDTSKLDGKITQSEYIDILLAAEQTTPAPSYPVPTLADSAEIYFVDGNNPLNENGELVIEAKDFGATAITFSGSGLADFSENPVAVDGVDAIAGSAATFEAMFDYSKDYSSPTKLLSFKVAGTSFYVSSGKMNGNIASDADFLAIMNSALNSEGKRLDEVATVNFNSLGGVSTVGKLSITALENRNETISYSDQGDGVSNPAVTAGIAPVQASISGAFDKTVDLTGAGKTLTFSYDGKTYTVDRTNLDGTATDAEVIAAISGADDGAGNLLSAVATINYDGTTLTVTANTPEDNKSFNYTDLGGGFTAIPSKVVGVTPKTPSFEGAFDVSDVVGQPFTFTFDSVVYTVDTSNAPTPLTEANFADRIRNASGGGGILDDVADINFTLDAGDVGHLSIVSDNDIGSQFEISLAVGLTDVIATTAGIASEEATKASYEGVVDISTDVNGAGQTLTFNVGKAPNPITTYTVTVADLDGNITHGEFVDLIKNADDGSGNILGTIADIEFTPHGEGSDIGTLKIELKAAGENSIVAAGTSIGASGDMHVDYPTVTNMEQAKIEGTFDFSTDYVTNGDTLAFEMDGVVYTVDTSTFDGSINETNFLLAIQNADDGSGNTLSSVANVAFDLNSGTEGTLTIEKSDGANANVRVTDTAGGFTAEPTLLDTDIDAILTGTEEITDALVADPEKGIGMQSFVVTYNDETKRIDVDLTGVTTMSDMETAINAELLDAFGLSDDTPPKNNVTFEIFNDGEKDVVRFIGDGDEDGSKTFLKVDVIVSDKPQLIEDIEEFSEALSNKDNDRIDQFLGEIDDHLDNIIKNLANIGAKTNRLDFIENRINDNNIAMTEILTKVQDIDYAEVTIQFKSLESIYRASLSVGAKVIQPTLVDFIQ